MKCKAGSKDCWTHQWYSPQSSISIAGNNLTCIKGHKVASIIFGYLFMHRLFTVQTKSSAKKHKQTKMRKMNNIYCKKHGFSFALQVSVSHQYICSYFNL